MLRCKFTKFPFETTDRIVDNPSSLEAVLQKLRSGYDACHCVVSSQANKRLTMARNACASACAKRFDSLVYSIIRPQQRMPTTRSPTDKNGVWLTICPKNRMQLSMRFLIAKLRQLEIWSIASAVVRSLLLNILAEAAVPAARSSPCRAFQP
jgi:hypothetical protein